MKKIFIIRWRRLLLCMLACFTVLFLYAALLSTADSHQVFNRMFNKLEEVLEKENARLDSTLEMILPQESVKLYEPKGRFIEETPVVTVSPLEEALRNGTSVSFDILYDDPGYRRIAYTPRWKDSFFRGWLYLPNKIILARHRLFIYPIGGSSTYDFIGELAFNKNIIIDSHRNQNFLVFDFDIQQIKYYNAQLLVVGTPERSGVQIVSVIQDAILATDEKTKDFIVQLATPGGMEVDFDYTNVMQYQYLKEQIQQHTVPGAAAATYPETYDSLVNDNLKLQKELSFYIPMPESSYEPDNTFTKDICKPIPPTFPMEEKSLREMRIEGADIPLQSLYEDPSYQRPIYHPAWKEHYRERWAFVPSQVCLNFSRLHILEGSDADKKRTLGMLGFDEIKKLPSQSETAFILYGFDIDHAILFQHQLLLIGTTQRDGVSYFTLNNKQFDRANYLVRMITTDNYEIDYAVFSPQQ